MQGAKDWTGPTTTFEDAWSLWYQVEEEYHCHVESSIWPPRKMRSGVLIRGRVSVAARWPDKPDSKPVSRMVDIGGTRGARTVPAALVRALSEIAQVLEERKDAAEQAALF